MRNLALRACRPVAAARAPAVQARQPAACGNQGNIWECPESFLSAEMQEMQKSLELLLPGSTPATIEGRASGRASCFLSPQPKCISGVSSHQDASFLLGWAGRHFTPVHAEDSMRNSPPQPRSSFKVRSRLTNQPTNQDKAIFTEPARRRQQKGKKGGGTGRKYGLEYGLELDLLDRSAVRPWPSVPPAHSIYWSNARDALVAALLLSRFLYYPHKSRVH